MTRESAHPGKSKRKINPTRRKIRLSKKAKLGGLGPATQVSWLTALLNHQGFGKEGLGSKGFVCQVSKENQEKNDRAKEERKKRIDTRVVLTEGLVKKVMAHRNGGTGPRAPMNKAGDQCEKIPKPKFGSWDKEDEKKRREGTEGWH